MAPPAPSSAPSAALPEPPPDAAAPEAPAAEAAPAATPAPAGDAVELQPPAVEPPPDAVEPPPDAVESTAGAVEPPLDIEVSVGEAVEVGTDDAVAGTDIADMASDAASADDSLDIPLTDVEPQRGPDRAREATSADPTALAPVVSVDVDVPAASRRRRRAFVVGGIVAGAAVLAGVLLAASGSAPRTLVVSVSDPQGGAISSVDVSVDGKLRCQISPCTVEGLEPGSHQVSVSAVGVSQGAEQAIDVPESGATHLAIRLPVEAAPRPVHTATPSDETRLPERTTVDDEETWSAENEEDAPSKDKKGRHRGKKGKSKARRKASGDSPTEPEPPEAPAAAGGEGGLMVMSEPSGMVYVDGRVYGPSPRQIRLPAGPHTVTVRHPDRGEHSASVNVIGGKTVSVMLNL